MSAEASQTLVESLADLGVDSTRTTPAEFGSALAAVVKPPTVGAEPQYDDVSLADVDNIDIELDPSLVDLRAATTGVTAAAFGITDYGSTILRTDQQPAAEHTSLFVDHHVIVLPERRIRPDMATAMADLGPLCRNEGASGIIATGPSATADMGALVKGAHGPETVHVLLVNDQ